MKEIKVCSPRQRNNNDIHFEGYARIRTSIRHENGHEITNLSWDLRLDRQQVDTKQCSTETRHR